MQFWSTFSDAKTWARYLVSFLGLATTTSDPQEILSADNAIEFMNICERVYNSWYDVFLVEVSLNMKGLVMLVGISPDVDLLIDFMAIIYCFVYYYTEYIIVCLWTSNSMTQNLYCFCRLADPDGMMNNINNYLHSKISKNSPYCISLWLWGI